jgi:hypothetical protein
MSEKPEDVSKQGADLLAKMMGPAAEGATTVAAMEQLETGQTKRRYTVIARKGEDKLWMNVDMGASKANKVGSKKAEDIATVLCLVIRLMETKKLGDSQNFAAFPQREDKTQVDDGYHRYMPIVLPICAFPAPNDYVREKWEKQKVTDLTRDWLKKKLGSVSATLAIPDEALDSLLTGPLDSKPTGELLYFQLPE